MPLSETSPSWDDLYREGHTPWDKGEASPPLAEWLGTHPGAMRGRILVPGCGTGHDVRLIAAEAEATAPVGLDLSPRAIARAATFPRAAGESYLVGDLFTLPAEHREVYDWIWEHTCFCAIDPDRRKEYADAVHAALKPDGRLLGVFYLDPYDDDHPPGGGPPHGCSHQELESLFIQSGLFTLEESYVPNLAYSGREGLERVLHLKKRP